MIGNKSVLTSPHGGVISASHLVHARDFSVMAWSCTLWYYQYSIVKDVIAGESEMYELHISKPEFGGPATCTLETICQFSGDQELLMFDGSWIRVDDLDDDERLQHYCGNGHYAVIKSIKSVGIAPGFTPVIDDKEVHGIIVSSVIARRTDV